MHDYNFSFMFCEFYSRLDKEDVLVGKSFQKLQRKGVVHLVDTN